MAQSPIALTFIRSESPCAMPAKQVRLLPSLAEKKRAALPYLFIYFMEKQRAPTMARVRPRAQTSYSAEISWPV
jgi:hypothetical protein